ncbi:pentaheme c-type cytochrome TorC [Shewanella sp. GXUN23E]|uniref:pentaheme c-type cytochrome TorC n=1 Tax=Shewanella sp. GXUN23E TaxID=3422498 RepID=UPI003D7E1D5F
MKWLSNLWRTLNRPSRYLTLGMISISAFIMGIIFWGGFNTAVEASSKEEFCISCHTMKDNPYKELQSTVHYSNNSGVRATCPDCHVPHDWTQKMAVKVAAAKDVYGEIFGVINTPEKYNAKRLEMASRVWKQFDRTKSQACKNCHRYESMNWAEMSPLAVKQMKQAAEKDQSCIDCHKGIAHHLPNMGTARAPELIAQVGHGVTPAVGQEYYSALTKELYEGPTDNTDAGILNIATEVKVLEAQGDRVKISLNGWRKRIGAGRVIYKDFGVNILSAQLTMEAAKHDGNIRVFEEKQDPLTGLTWQRVEVDIWTSKDYLLQNPDMLWSYAKDTYNTSCSVCHTQPEPSHFDANTWPGMFQGMLAFVNLDQDTTALVQKYLQEHSSTFDKSGQH